MPIIYGSVHNSIEAATRSWQPLRIYRRVRNSEKSTFVLHP